MNSAISHACPLAQDSQLYFTSSAISAIICWQLPHRQDAALALGMKANKNIAKYPILATIGNYPNNTNIILTLYHQANIYYNKQVKCVSNSNVT